jgi:hypothetical protein
MIDLTIGYTAIQSMAGGCANGVILHPHRAGRHLHKAEDARRQLPGDLEVVR